MRAWTTCAVLLLAAILCAPPGWGAPEEKEDPKLLGQCTAEQLGEEPFSAWFKAGYSDYTPNPEVVKQLRAVDREGVEITVFFGTWCGDSQREVPRLLKLLDELEFPSADRTLVAIDAEPEAYKVSPSGEEKGMEVYRVPTIVISRGDQEVARIVEYPVLSLERDLLAILSGEPYEPSYTSYPTVRRWLRDGLLRDANISFAGLAAQVRGQVRSEGELTAAARVLLSRGDIREAVTLFRVNCVLYPESSRAFARLAEGLRALGEAAEAREMAEKALRLNDDPGRVGELLELIESTGK
jgi:thiol-disulfide isomerase/thioredoxin